MLWGNSNTELYLLSLGGKVSRQFDRDELAWDWIGKMGHVTFVCPLFGDMSHDDTPVSPTRISQKTNGIPLLGGNGPSRDGHDHIPFDWKCHKTKEGQPSAEVRDLAVSIDQNAASTPLTSKIDTQNNHVCKETHFPNQHVWYLC